ncbi:MAG: hypothetical protein BGN86_10255 [Caulobacterales bacterium 68-7]|nr:MAG: hypothetical protein BGN86_10255 [Caulobacterales bacterium 68-7]
MTLFRKLALLAAAVFAIIASQFHEITGLGVSIAQFSADADTTLRAAGYAFAVWGLLYLGMLAFAVYHATPAGDRSILARRTAWPAAGAFAACGLWVVVASLQLYALTLAIIVVAAGVLVARLTGLAGADARAADGKDEWFVLWPLAALAGWLTVASGLNAVSVAERYHLLADATPTVVAGVLAVVLIGLSLFVGLTIRSVSYPLLIAWGLVAVAVAERPTQPMVASIAVASALICLAGGLILRRRPPPSLRGAS